MKVVTSTSLLHLLLNFRINCPWTYLCFLFTLQLWNLDATFQSLIPANLIWLLSPKFNAQVSQEKSGLWAFKLSPTFWGLFCVCKFFCISSERNHSKQARQNFRVQRSDCFSSVQHFKCFMGGIEFWSTALLLIVFLIYFQHLDIKRLLKMLCKVTSYNFLLFVIL